MEAVSTFFKRKDVVISAHRYGIDAMGAMGLHLLQFKLTVFLLI